MTSFYSVKERQPSCKIKQIHHDNEDIMNPEQTVRIMQEW
jgi:hypothetical protein